MITRRQLIAAAGGGAVVAGAGLSLPERFEAQAQGLNLPAALPEGVRANVIMDALPGKKPLIKLSYLCVPKIRFCNIGDEGRRGQAVM